VSSPLLDTPLRWTFALDTRQPAGPAIYALERIAPAPLFLPVMIAPILYLSHGLGWAGLVGGAQARSAAARRGDSRAVARRGHRPPARCPPTPAHAALLLLLTLFFDLLQPFLHLSLSRFHRLAPNTPRLVLGWSAPGCGGPWPAESCKMTVELTTRFLHRAGLRREAPSEAAKIVPPPGFVFAAAQQGERAMRAAAGGERERRGRQPPVTLRAGLSRASAFSSRRRSTAFASRLIHTAAPFARSVTACWHAACYGAGHAHLRAPPAPPRP